jgi:hypothetical protein
VENVPSLQSCGTEIFGNLQNCFFNISIWFIFHFMMTRCFQCIFFNLASAQIARNQIPIDVLGRNFFVYSAAQIFSCIFVLTISTPRSRLILWFRAIWLDRRLYQITFCCPNK